MELENYLDLSLKNNTISVFGPIDTNASLLVINQLQYLDYKFKKDNVPYEDRVITMQINSPGGNISDGFAIYDTMNSVDCFIRTVAVGAASSMGAFLLSSGSKGMRFATENAEMLIHQPLGGVQGQATDMIIAAKHIEKLRDRINKIMASNTNKTVEQIRLDTERDTILDANEALAYGLIDGIIKCERK